MFRSKTSKRTWVKLCEFESLDAAYEAAQLGADALGFHCFRHHDLCERRSRFAPILSQLPCGVDRTLLTDLELPQLVKVVRELPVDSVQLYPDWEPEEVVRLRAVVGRPINILKVMSARPEENFTADDGAFLARYAAVADAILLDSTRAGGSGRVADWGHCAAIVRQSSLPVVLAGGLTTENVQEAMRVVRPFGVDVETGVSDRIPGGPLVKNMAKCAAFIRAVRIADDELGDRSLGQRLGAKDADEPVARPRREGDDGRSALEKQRSLTGEPYRILDPQLVQEYNRGNRLIRAYNGTGVDEADRRNLILRRLFGKLGTNPDVEPPFYCCYGSNICAGNNLSVNFGCVILDCHQVRLGDDVKIGPRAQIYTASHPLDRTSRAAGLGLAKPVTIGDNVWVGGGAIILPGVTIGDNTVIGAGSVVTKSLPANVLAVGNPCRIKRPLS